tara:strand:- start:5311 stop:6708 length:1398 start_codon:yes stop_codon:yes gene_type:complete
MSRIFFLILILAAAAGAAEPPNFEDHVLPIFKQHCNGCHNPDKRKADLDLTSYSGVVKGSSGGEVVKAGVPDTSWLYESIIHAEDVEAMPPKKPKIGEAQIALIHKWIGGGLLEAEGGKSKLRNVRFDLATGSMERPENPAMPTNLPKVPLAKTRVAPPILALASSPWANLIAVNGHKQILLYGRPAENEEWALLGILPFPEGDVHDLRFSRNGDLLVAAGGEGAHSGKVAVFDVRTGQRKATIGDEQDIVLSADVSSDHRFVAIGTPAKKVKIFSAENGQQLHTIDKHTDWVSAVRFSPDGKMLATGDRNGGIHIWESESAGILYSLDEHKVRITSLSWRADGQLLASAGEDGKFVLWDMKDGWPTRTASPHAVKQEPSRYTRQTGILDLAFARDGRFLTVGRDRTLRLWKTDGNAVGPIRELEALPIQAVFGWDGKQVITGDFAGNLRIWDEESRSFIQELRP